MEGTITLYDYNNDFITSSRYKGLSNRKSIILNWRNKYGKRMDRMYLQVAPNYFSSQKKPRK